MKKIILMSITTALLLGGMSSCKKGENDPFLSLRGRKSRVAGEWTVSASESTDVNTGGGGTVTTTTTYNGSIETSTQTSSFGGSVTSTTAYTDKYTFEKDGTYTYTNIDEDGDVTTVTGTWFFLGKSKENELENKEAIFLTVDNITSGGSSNTYDDLDGTVFVIDQLKNKEMIFTVNSSSSGGGNSTTYSSKTTLTQ